MPKLHAVNHVVASPAPSASAVVQLVDARVAAIASQVARESASGVHQVVVSGSGQTVPRHEDGVSAEMLTGIGTLLLAVFTWLLWCATRKLVKGADSTARTQLRAYINIKVCFVQRQSDDTVLIGIDFQNFGQTPAHFVADWSNWALMPVGTLPPFVPPPVVEPRGSMGPGQEKQMRISTKVLTANEFSEVVAGRALVWVEGLISYQDVFGEKRQTPFRMYSTGDNYLKNTLVVDATGNDST